MLDAAGRYFYQFNTVIHSEMNILLSSPFFPGVTIEIKIIWQKLS